MRQINGESRHGVSLEHLVGKVHTQLTIGGRGAVKHLQRFGNVQPKPLGQRQGFGIDLAERYCNVVVDQLGPPSGAHSAAVINACAHRIKQGLDTHKIGITAAHHKERLATVRVLCQAPHRCINN